MNKTELMEILIKYEFYMNEVKNHLENDYKINLTKEESLELFKYYLINIENFDYESHTLNNYKNFIKLLNRKDIFEKDNDEVFKKILNHEHGNKRYFNIDNYFIKIYGQWLDTNEKKPFLNEENNHLLLIKYTEFFIKQIFKKSTENRFNENNRKIAFNILKKMEWNYLDELSKRVLYVNGYSHKEIELKEYLEVIKRDYVSKEKEILEKILFKESELKIKKKRI